YDRSLPTMMWINQRPTDGTHREAWLNIDLVSPWRAAGLLRYIAAAEIGGGEFFNPVVPEELAGTLRRL
ncbi:MAG: galactose-1-phosphate uridylyltransferase, partial [Ilumatobacteraceae bacterium]